jgi:hypothetical protein
MARARQPSGSECYNTVVRTLQILLMFLISTCTEKLKKVLLTLQSIYSPDEQELLIFPTEQRKGE